MRGVLGFFGGLIIFLSSSGAAIRKNMPVKFNKLDMFAAAGIFQGGESGRAYSLIGVKRAPANKGAHREKITIEYGDEVGRRILGKTGYFHVTLEQNPPRLVIDLNQVQKTAIDDKQLAAIFRNSDLVASTQMTMDPEDLSTNITLNFKVPVKARVQANTDPKRPGQVVVDIIKQSSTSNLNPIKGIK